MRADRGAGGQGCGRCRGRGAPYLFDADGHVHRICIVFASYVHCMCIAGAYRSSSISSVVGLIPTRGSRARPADTPSLGAPRPSPRSPASVRARFPLAVLTAAGVGGAVGGATGSAAAATGAGPGGAAERLVTAAGALLGAVTRGTEMMLLLAEEAEDEGVSSGSAVGIDWLARRAPAAGGSGSMAGRVGSVAPVASSVTGSGEVALRWARAARSSCAAASLSPPLRSRSERASSSELFATSGQDTVDVGLEMPASK